jgi:hypothetical protein
MLGLTLMALVGMIWVTGRCFKLDRHSIGGIVLRIPDKENLRWFHIFAQNKDSTAVVGSHNLVGESGLMVSRRGLKLIIDAPDHSRGDVFDAVSLADIAWREKRSIPHAKSVKWIVGEKNHVGCSIFSHCNIARRFTFSSEVAPSIDPTMGHKFYVHTNMYGCRATNILYFGSHIKEHCILFTKLILKAWASKCNYWTFYIEKLYPWTIGRFELLSHNVPLASGYRRIGSDYDDSYDLNPKINLANSAIKVALKIFKSALWLVLDFICCGLGLVQLQCNVARYSTLPMIVGMAFVGFGFIVVGQVFFAWFLLGLVS